jgi:hypothetical protein
MAGKTVKNPDVVVNATNDDTKINLKTIYTFVFGRNIYTVRLNDIKKVTLLGHNFIENKDDKEEVTKTLYIFSVVGNQIQGMSEPDANDNPRPMYETIMEVKAEEDDYGVLYKIYEDLIIKWDEFQQLPLSNH